MLCVHAVNMGICRKELFTLLRTLSFFTNNVGMHWTLRHEVFLLTTWECTGLLGILLVDLDWIHVRIRSSISHVLMLVSLAVMGGVIYVDYVRDGLCKMCRCIVSSFYQFYLFTVRFAMG